MSIQANVLILAVSFGIAQFLLPIFLIFRIRNNQGDKKPKYTTVILGGLLPSLLLYWGALVQSFLTGEDILKTSVILVFIVGAFEIISLPMSFILSKWTHQLVIYQAILAGAVIPVLLWFLLFYMVSTSGI